MNKLIVSGRPTRDPEIFYSGEGEKQKTVAKFTIASNRIFKREGDASADFIPVVAFGRQAKFIETYIRKGMLIQLTGPLRNNDYVNKEGEKRHSFQMVAETVEIFEKKNESQSQGSAPEPDSEGYMQMTEEEMADMPFN